VTGELVGLELELVELEQEGLGRGRCAPCKPPHICRFLRPSPSFIKEKNRTVSQLFLNSVWSKSAFVGYRRKYHHNKAFISLN